MPEARFNHIAFLVRSARESAEVEALRPFHKGPAEKWEGEGTLEIYVGPEESTARLLLMEAIAEGAYQRALKKRGPGLHHIAIDVLDIEAYLLSLGGSGWLLHPHSLKTLKATRTAYLARPGIPLLIEVQEREEFSRAERFINRIELPLPPESLRILHRLGVQELEGAPGSRISLGIGGATVDAAGIWVVQQ